MNKIKKLLLIFFALAFVMHTSVKAAPASFANLAERLMSSVVNISTVATVSTNSNPIDPKSPLGDMFKEFGTPQKKQSAALGSGFIIDSKGIVITNNHVIEGAEEIFVKVDGDKEYKAKVIGADPLSDIAVLQIISRESISFKSVKFGNSDKARIGDWVIAIGNPFGLGGTVTAGIISARNRSIGLSRYENYIQTDASINSGNSGGPLFDMKGNVIGINTAILGKGGSIGIGFSIPSNSAKKVISQLIDFGETRRGWLGVRIQMVTKEIADKAKLDDPYGALVAGVAKRSPSDKAGIKEGDIILEFDGTKINEMKELPLIVAQTEVGKIVDVKVWRNKKQIIKKIELGRLETSEEFLPKKPKPKKPKKPKKITELYIDSLKIRVRVLTKEEVVKRRLPNQTKGLVILNIENDSKFKGVVTVGSIIIQAQRTNTNNIEALLNVLKQMKKRGERMLLLNTYNDKNKKQYFGIKVN